MAWAEAQLTGLWQRLWRRLTGSPRP
jgi:hypothetical protein